MDVSTGTGPDDRVESDDDALEDYAFSDEAGGESVLSDDPFFVSKQAAAVFKHKLLGVYFPKFAGKAGSTEPDRRLVYVDTHAGRGSYDDGTAGSPLLIARNVARMTQRRIDCLFIEANRSNHSHLKVLLDREMPPHAIWDALHGAASDHLSQAVAFAADSPLFMFIDPYGLGPSFPEVVRILNRPRKGFGSKTEVLNFISAAFARAGGYLRMNTLTPQRIKTLEHLDEVLHGRWWRDVYLSADSTSDAVREIAASYARRVERATGCRATLIPVRNRAHHVPLYWLVHFTKHPDGVWWIREAASQASAEWRRYCSPPPPADDGTLFALEDPFPEEEQRRQAHWIDHIEDNARRLLDRVGVVKVREDVQALYGETDGLAWSKHLRAALARVHDAGGLQPKPMAKDLDKYVGTRPLGS